jgi:hypothetical protein
MNSSNVIPECGNFIFCRGFDKKLLADSLVVVLRNMYVSMFVGFRIKSRPRTFFHPLLSCVELNFMSLCN